MYTLPFDWIPTFVDIYHLLSFVDGCSHRSELDFIIVWINIFMKIPLVWSFPIHPPTGCFILPSGKCLFISFSHFLIWLLSCFQIIWILHSFWSNVWANIFSIRSLPPYSLDYFLCCSKIFVCYNPICLILLQVPLRITSKNFIKTDLKMHGAGAMAQRFRAFILQRTQVWFPAFAQCLTNIWNSRSRIFTSSSVFCCLLHTYGSQTHT